MIYIFCPDLGEISFLYAYANALSAILLIQFHVFKIYIFMYSLGQHSNYTA
jgi:hypothetical protein